MITSPSKPIRLSGAKPVRPALPVPSGLSWKAKTASGKADPTVRTTSPAPAPTTTTLRSTPHFRRAAMVRLMAGTPATGKQTLGMLVSPMRRPRPPAMLMDAVFRCGPPIAMNIPFAGLAAAGQAESARYRPRPGAARFSRIQFRHFAPRGKGFVRDTCDLPPRTPSLPSSGYCEERRPMRSFFQTKSNNRQTNGLATSMATVPTVLNHHGR